MIIDFNQLNGTQAYHLMTQTVIPRPVAWVLTENESGNYNLAPFSFFTAVCSAPPILMFSVGKKPSGEIKDTRRNIERTKGFVIHIAGMDLVEDMTESSRTLDYGVSEVDQSGLELNTDWQQPLPRLTHCSVAMYCELHKIDEIGDNQQGVVYGEIKQMFLADSVVRQSDRLVVNAAEINPVARLGANEYAGLESVIAIARPE
jgi:flavin reductase (DIM6/NTAB) family NADH-FMN oxidoreductase RutF